MATLFTSIRLAEDYQVVKLTLGLGVTSEDKVEVKVKSGEL